MGTVSSELFDSKPQVKRKLNVLPVNPEVGQARGRFPSWLHRKLPKGGSLWDTKKSMREGKLHTVCEEAKCPNLLECWSQKTATFLALGKACTRSCGFCDIDFTKNPPPPDKEEPKRIAESALDLGLRHVVITMVARDDLEDGGALHIAKIIQEVRKLVKNVTVEVLTTAFQGNEYACKLVLQEKPEVFNHNIETVRRLTSRVRHVATYEGTLSCLDYVKKSDTCRFVKSGIMVGLGEREGEVFETIDDLAKVGCDLMTIGQYLQPSRHKLLVKEFVHPDQFEKYKKYGESKGIKMFCGPFVRSSYHAGQVLEE